jgi:glycosyltransferase involved in cell wall biosynthesis
MRQRHGAGVPDVLLLSPTPPPVGGIARWTMLVMEENRARPRATIRLVDTRRRLLKPHVPVPAAARGAIGGLELIPIAAQVLRQFIRRRPDVVHLTTSGSVGFVRDLAVLALARLFGVRSVVHMKFGRIPDVLQAGTTESRLLQRVANAADRVIVLDEGSHRALAVVGVDAALVPNGIPTPSRAVEPPPKAADRPFALFVGWVLPAKGVYELVRAWTKAEASRGMDLVLAGPVEPSVAEELSLLAGPDTRVTLRGALDPDEVEELMARCGALVLPSHSEGLPLSLLEAMALGKPVIATPVGAIAELLRDGAGLVVPVGDEEELAAALDEVLLDKERSAELGDRARARVRKEYSMRHVCDRYAEVWMELSIR